MAPIHVAASHNQVDCLRSFLEDGLNADQRMPQTGLTPLMIAAKRGYVDVVQLLLDYGANLDATCEEGRTALHYAQEAGQKEVAELLRGEEGIAALVKEFSMKANVKTDTEDSEKKTVLWTGPAKAKAHRPVVSGQKVVEKNFLVSQVLTLNGTKNLVY
jgi:ankyrin repeat protein